MTNPTKKKQCPSKLRERNLATRRFVSRHHVGSRNRWTNGIQAPNMETFICWHIDRCTCKRKRLTSTRNTSCRWRYQYISIQSILTGPKCMQEELFLYTRICCNTLSSVINHRRDNKYIQTMSKYQQQTCHWSISYCVASSEQQIMLSSSHSTSATPILKRPWNG